MRELIDVTKRHDLDDSEIHAARMSPFEQACNLFFVHILKRDSIDFDLQSCGLSCIDAGDDLVEVTPPCNGAELVDVESVERDINAVDAVSLEL